MSKLRNMDFLSDKISNSSSNIGFETEQSESEYYEEDEDRDFYLGADDLEESYPGLNSEDIEHLKRRIKTSPKRR